jgi:hypothetical protein
MNLVNYGISDATVLFKNIVLARLKTGENLISYSYHHSNGIVLFLPMELVRQEDDSFSMRSFLPFVKERIFYISIDDVQLVKSNLIQYISDSYIKMTETLYKNDIDDVLFSAESFKQVEAEIELSSGAIVH